MTCILMNKNTPVAEVNLDEDTAIILGVKESFKLDFLPIGIDCREETPDKKKLNEWWLGRAIPKNRFGLRGALEQMEINQPGLFPSDTENVTKPLRMALGALIIQTKFGFSDRELVAQITENAYLQYFIGLLGYQDEPPFDASTLVLFRKRISAEMLVEANEYLLGHNDSNDNNSGPSGGGEGVSECTSEKEIPNSETLMLDATCAPANIRYPQDISLLNESREKLEVMLYRFHKAYGLSLPRRYSPRARKDYLIFAKGKKHSGKKIRKALRKQLSYVARDINYLERFLSEGHALEKKEIRHQ